MGVMLLPCRLRVSVLQNVWLKVLGASDDAALCFNDGDSLV